MNSRRAWFVRLSATALRDYQDILDWTAGQFGEAQSDAYANILDNAIEALSEGGIQTMGVRKRRDLAALYLFHIARGTHKARHFIMFRISRSKNGEFVEVLRILHDSMDIPRHLGGAGEDET
jgi:toxin ParE1/3/4